MKTRSTSLIGWLGISPWAIVAAVIFLALLPAVKIQSIQPAKFEIQLGGK